MTSLPEFPAKPKKDGPEFLKMNGLLMMIWSSLDQSPVSCKHLFGDFRKSLINCKVALAFMSLFIVHNID